MAVSSRKDIATVATTCRSIISSRGLQHPWITGEQNDGLASFAGSNKLKQLLVRTVAENLDTQRRNQLESEFQSVDLNGDGRIDEDELTEFLIKNEIEETVAREKALIIIHEIVGAGHKRISLRDWSHASVAKLLSSETLIKRQYLKLDVDGDKRISSDDLLKIFEGASPEEVQAIIDEVDTDKDGNISYEEFRAAMTFQPVFTLD